MQLLKRRFTVQDYEQMAQAGILKPDERIELIEGEVVEMSPIGSRHAACVTTRWRGSLATTCHVNRLNQIFSQIMGERVVIGVQNPITLGDRSQLQPDLALLKRRDDFYAAQHPQPEDVLLLVEVADPTIEYDREVKIPLYAKSGISQVWLIDLNHRSIEVYTEPTIKGYTYQKLERSQRIILQTFPDVHLTVDDLLK